VASDAKTEFKIGRLDTEIKIDTKNKVPTRRCSSPLSSLSFTCRPGCRPGSLHLHAQTRACLGYAPAVVLSYSDSRKGRAGGRPRRG